VLALPGAADPDKFLREQGPDAYKKLLAQAPAYLDYLIGRARRMDLGTASGKVAAMNYLMPYVKLLPDRLLRSEWATRIASELRVDEPVLREALRRAAVERRAEVQPKVELLAPAVKPVERQLMRMLMEGEGLREKLASEIMASGLHRGLESEKILELLISKASEKVDPASLAAELGEKDGRLLFEVLFEAPSEATWETAENCLNVLRGRRDERELAELQKQIEAKTAPEELNRLLTRRLDLQRKLARR
jgi:DNA primase